MKRGTLLLLFAVVLLVQGCAPSQADKARLLKQAEYAPNGASADQRLAAVRQLRKLKAPSLAEDFCQCLYDEDERVNLEAAWALSEIGLPAIEPLFAWGHRGQLVAAIVLRVGPQAIKPMIEGGLGDDQMADGASFVLRQMRSGQEMELLTRKLDSDNFGDIDRASRLLGELGDTRATEPLVKAYFHARRPKDQTGPDPREPIVRALVKLKDPCGLPAFLDAIMVEESDSSLPYLGRMGIVEAKARQAWPALVFLLQNYPKKAALAASVLGDLGETKATPYLRAKGNLGAALVARAKLGNKQAASQAADILNDPARKALHVDAAETIGILREKSSADLLVRTMKSADPNVSAACVSALAAMDYRQAAEGILAILKAKDADPQVKTACVTALTVMNYRPVAGQILALLNDKTDPELLLQAIRAMKAMKLKPAAPILRAMLMKGEYEPELPFPTALPDAGVEDVKEEGVAIIADLEGPASIEFLIKVVQDQERRFPGVRGNALIALSRFDDPRANRCLVNALDDPSSFVAVLATGILQDRPVHNRPAIRKALAKYAGDIRPWVAKLAK